MSSVRICGLWQVYYLGHSTQRQFSSDGTKFVIFPCFLPSFCCRLRAGYRLAFVSAEMIYSAGGQQLLGWCLVGTSGNFVGREPPDRITFGWLASIPFVSIGCKLRLTSNTLDRRDRSLEIAEAERGRVHQASVLRHNLPALP